ncbi:MAG TPA: TetR/AcrR family transcriptional regulator [Candidatus Limnocylindrales bacterium]|nr:TetR/AcrR family transcriptional regulator [Candidatus Limnocylindrales bacterium]
MTEELAPARRRRTPTQDRSRETFEAICAAASSLIEEGGIAALTTNAVARRAGVSITAVYAYFEDKWAIVHELFNRFEQLRADALRALFADFDEREDWRPVIDETWARMAEFRVEVPGAMPLRHAMAGQPGLARLDYEGSIRSATLFADAMVRRRPSLSWEDAYRASWAVTLIAGVLIDDAVRDGTIAWDRLWEGTSILKLHLARYLDDEPGT